MTSTRVRVTASRLGGWTTDDLEAAPAYYHGSVQRDAEGTVVRERVMYDASPTWWLVRFDRYQADDGTDVTGPLFVPCVCDRHIEVVS